MERIDGGLSKRSLKRGTDFSHETPEVAFKDALAGCLVDERQSYHASEVGNSRMRDIEEADLTKLKRLDIVHHLGSCPVPRRPAVIDKGILDDPLSVRLAHRRRRVEIAEDPARQIHIRWAGHGGDAIHHRRWETALGLNPAMETLVLGNHLLGHAPNRDAHHLTIQRHIITGHDGERAVPRAPTPI
mmetsp:Transcript_8426/g.17126  ORF Transcript_8426/g.17126 Transcript_8426/m.17126 type:complete len:187 (+) Transcript_8426:712-1272(+)